MAAGLGFPKAQLLKYIRSERKHPRYGIEVFNSSRPGFIAICFRTGKEFSAVRADGRPIPAALRVLFEFDFDEFTAFHLYGFEPV